MSSGWPIFSIFALITASASAEPTGPPPPPAAARSPAEQAISLYERTYAHSIGKTICAPTRGADIVVCGNGRSPDRLPLPEERGPRDGPRTAIAEMPSTAGGVGGSPALQNPGTGVNLSIGLGGKQSGSMTVKGHSEE